MENKFINLFNNNRPLNLNDKKELVLSLNSFVVFDSLFYKEGEETVLPSELVAILQKYGPFWVTIDNDPSIRRSNHAVVVVDISTDINPEKTQIKYYDVADSSRIRQAGFVDFVSMVRNASNHKEELKYAIVRLAKPIGEGRQKKSNKLQYIILWNSIQSCIEKKQNKHFNSKTWGKIIDDFFKSKGDIIRFSLWDIYNFPLLYQDLGSLKYIDPSYYESMISKDSNIVSFITDNIEFNDNYKKTLNISNVQDLLNLPNIDLANLIVNNLDLPPNLFSIVERSAAISSGVAPFSRLISGLSNSFVFIAVMQFAFDIFNLVLNSSKSGETLSIFGIIARATVAYHKKVPINELVKFNSVTWGHNESEKVKQREYVKLMNVALYLLYDIVDNQISDFISGNSDYAKFKKEVSGNLFSNVNYDYILINYSHFKDNGLNGLIDIDLKTYNFLSRDLKLENTTYPLVYLYEKGKTAIEKMEEQEAFEALFYRLLSTTSNDYLFGLIKSEPISTQMYNDFLNRGRLQYRK